MCPGIALPPMITHRITQGNEECSSRDLGIEKVEVVDIKSHEMETNSVHVVMTKNIERIFTLVPVNEEALLARVFAYPAPHNPTESSAAG